MAIKTSRDYEHENSRDSGLARRSTVAKRSSDPVAITHGMHERTDTSIGAPPRDNSPPDASSPLPTDPEKQHGDKRLPIPPLHSAFKSDPQRGSYRPDSSGEVIGEAIISGSSKLPAAVKED